MIIGHLPFGYVVSKLIAQKIAGSKLNLQFFIVAGVLGAVIPDIDMLYFYFIDNRQHHHHTYWTHFPIVWVSLLVICTIWYQVAYDKTKVILGLIFSLSGVLHMMLDSIVGDIW